MSRSFCLLFLMISAVPLIQAQCINGIPNAGNSACASCNDQWSGPKCDIECTCAKGTCNAGVSGDGSCTNCFTGLYGPDCNRVCTCQFGTCKSLPDLATGGECATCNSQWLLGVNCDSCPSGRAGPICDIVCPNCGSHGTCDAGIKKSGRCICAAGWYGGGCNRNQLTRTKTVSKSLHFTPIPPTPVPPSTPMPTAEPTTTAKPVSVVPVTTLGPEVELIQLWFSRPVLLSKVKSTLGTELGIAADTVGAEYLEGSSQVVLVTLPTQVLFYELIAALKQGNAVFGALGLSQYSERLVQGPTTPPPPTPVPTPNPELRLAAAEGEGIAPVAVAFISIAVLALVVGVIIGAIYLWIRKERKKQAVENEKLTNRRVQYGEASGAAGGSSEEADIPAATTGTASTSAGGMPKEVKNAAPASLLEEDEEMGFNQLPTDQNMTTTGAPEAKGTSSDSSTGGVLKRKTGTKPPAGGKQAESSLAVQKKSAPGKKSGRSPMAQALGLETAAPPPIAPLPSREVKSTNESAAAARRLADDMVPSNNQSGKDVDPIQAEFDDVDGGNYSPPESATVVMPPTAAPDADLEFQLDEMPEE